MRKYRVYFEAVINALYAEGKEDVIKVLQDILHRAGIDDIIGDVEIIDIDANEIP